MCASGVAPAAVQLLVVWVTRALTLVIPLVAGSLPLLLVVAGSLQGEEAVGAAFPSCCHLLGSEWHFHIAVGKQGGKKPVISGKELLSDGRQVGCAVRYCLLHPANHVQQTPVSLLGFCHFGNSKPSSFSAP